MIFKLCIIDFYTIDTHMYHMHCICVFTVIVNEYLGQYYHRLINFNGNKIVRQEEKLHYFVWNDLFCITETAAISNNFCLK